ncbi:hypothetical protein [uncultured Paludibaculum sp.]|uniref:hypothetical protein n=1 Tax=uncultured Paludibaculum sp. TaxID=1765020 RepID=UPI002AAAFE3B|nr:hypothetical protein [uncultured Paludibaculum sp.]
MTRFFGLVTVRRRGQDAEAAEPEVKAADQSRPLGLAAPGGLDVLPEITRLAAEELKRKTEAVAIAAAAPSEVQEKVDAPRPVTHMDAPALPETRWQRAGRLRAMGMREERIAADLGVLTSDLRLRWKLESLCMGRPAEALSGRRTNSSNGLGNLRQ